MTLIGRLHPLLVHFPIGLVVIAAALELTAAVTGLRRLRRVAVANVRIGAGFAVAAAITGWRLAPVLGLEPSLTLGWHRWLGTIAALATLVAAGATAAIQGRSPAALWFYRLSLCGAAAAVGLTGHLGGMLVWGADFLRP